MDSLKDGQTRIVPLDLDDEVLGVGMPCGGTMDVYVEPYLPRPELHLIGHGRIAEVLAELAHLMHFMVTVNDPAAVRERFPRLTDSSIVIPILNSSKSAPTPLSWLSPSIREISIRSKKH